MNANDFPKHRYALLLVPGFSSFAVSSVIEPLFVANWLTRKPLFQWTTLSVDGFAVPSSNGEHKAVDAPLSSGAHGDFDTIFVIASFGAREADMTSRIVEWLRLASRRGVRIGAIETGSEILMDAGLIQNNGVPTHWYNAKGNSERHPDLKITETMFEATGTQPISAGGVATIDMMLDLIAQAAGDKLSLEVGKHFLMSERRPGSRPQPSAYGSPPVDHASRRQDDPVTRTHAIMEKHIEDPISCAELAKMVDVSLRHLQRLFRARLGRGMEATYRELRLAKAHQLVQQTNISLTEVAIASGFSSLEVFSRTYSSRFGVAPSRDRRQALDTTVFHGINDGPAPH